LQDKDEGCKTGRRVVWKNQNKTEEQTRKMPIAGHTHAVSSDIKPCSAVL